MLRISCLTLNLPSNEQRKSQINCPLFFFFLFTSPPLLGKRERNYRQRLIVQFMNSCGEGTNVPFNIKASGSGGGVGLPSCGCLLHWGTRIFTWKNGKSFNKPQFEMKPTNLFWVSVTSQLNQSLSVLYWSKTSKSLSCPEVFFFFPLYVSGLETADFQPHQKRERDLPATEKMLPA